MAEAPASAEPVVAEAEAELPPVELEGGWLLSGTWAAANGYPSAKPDAIIAKAKVDCGN